MKYFVTHYKPLKERKQNLLIQLKKENIEAEFIEVFDREELTNNELKIFHQNIKPSVASLICKHIECYRRVVESYEYAVIFEDDVILEQSFEEKLKKYIKQLPEDWDMLFIGNGCNLHINKKLLKKDVNVYKKSVYPSLMTFYHELDLEVQWKSYLEKEGYDYYKIGRINKNENLDNKFNFENFHSNKFNSLMKNIVNKDMKYLQKYAPQDTHIYITSDGFYEVKNFENFTEDEKNCIFYSGMEGGAGGSRCSDSYLVNKKCAKKIIEYIKIIDEKIDKGCDWWLNRIMKKLNLNIYWAEPTIVEQGSQTNVYKRTII